MKVLVTGACGFVGRRLCERLPTLIEGLELHGLDNLARVGSELNRSELRRLGVRFHRVASRRSPDADGRAIRPRPVAPSVQSTLVPYISPNGSAINSTRAPLGSRK